MVIKRCPVCGKKQAVRSSSRRGFWEKSILSVLWVRPYRCGSCQSRFYRFSLRNVRNSNGRPQVRPQEKDQAEAPPQFSSFLNPDDQRGVQDFFRELQDAENRMKLETEKSKK